MVQDLDLTFIVTSLIDRMLFRDCVDSERTEPKGKVIDLCFAARGFGFHSQPADRVSSKY